MWFIVIGILVIGLIAAIAGLLRNRRLQQQLERGEIDSIPEPEEAEECCGQHETCEKDSLLAAVSRSIEYYDDEELDRFRGTASEDYDDAAIAEFSEVLYTLRDVEVAGWVRSLMLREIELPEPLKDEVYLILGERRK